MDKILLYLPALACPIGMGVMMWLMMRPKRQQSESATPSAQEQELSELRSEIAALREVGSDPATKHYTAS